MATTILYRPVGQPEFDLIAASRWRRFPPRLDWQPIFYPVLNEAYATRIAREWNTKDDHNGNVGYVLRFAVDTDYLSQFDTQQVGDHECLEYWIPAEGLDAFNDHIRGEIEVLSEWRPRETTTLPNSRPSSAATWNFESGEDGAPTVIVDASEAFNEALADSVGTLSPRGRAPELSTYWIDQAIESVEGLADEGRPFLSGNSTSLTLREGSVWATSEYESFEDSSMPTSSFAALLKEWKDRVKAIPTGERSRPSLSPYQRNHSFVSKWITQQLIATVPEFEPDLTEHMKDHGEVLAHLLFGDLTRFVLQEHAAGRREVVDRCLRFLEKAARYGDDEVVNLVAVSFVENVGPWDFEVQRFISTWPSRLREIATEQGWRGAPSN